MEREEEDEADDPSDEQTIAVTYATAWELWRAWNNSGVMPQAGGYLDQPRWWRRILRLFGGRYQLAREQAKAEKKLLDEMGGEGDW